jgi:hypothetical protein
MGRPQRLIERPRAVEFAIELKDFGRFRGSWRRRDDAALRQRGVALLIAMLAVTVGTIIAVNLMWQGTLDLRRAESALAPDQGMLYMQGAEAGGGHLASRRSRLAQSDNLGEIWATELPPLPVDGGTIQGKLEDLQGRFNLNSLIDNRGRPDPIALKQSSGSCPYRDRSAACWRRARLARSRHRGPLSERRQDSTYAAATPPTAPQTCRSRRPPSSWP